MVLALLLTTALVTLAILVISAKFLYASILLQMILECAALPMVHALKKILVHVTLAILETNARFQFALV
jgi:hypothetical protein